jgi:hypothetical protein
MAGLERALKEAVVRGTSAVTAVAHARPCAQIASGEPPAALRVNPDNPLAAPEDIHCALACGGLACLPTALMPARAAPPTYFRAGPLARTFQGIVDTYGVPRYKVTCPALGHRTRARCSAHRGAAQEVNPGLFTIVTFPFLFGLMVRARSRRAAARETAALTRRSAVRRRGARHRAVDLRHLHAVVRGRSAGAITRRASSRPSSPTAPRPVVRAQVQARRKKMSEFSEMAFEGRYALLLMGLAAVYCGLVYNDCMSVPLWLFDSTWCGRVRALASRLRPRDEPRSLAGIAHQGSGASQRIACIRSALTRCAPLRQSRCALVVACANRAGAHGWAPRRPGTTRRTAWRSSTRSR